MPNLNATKNTLRELSMGENKNIKSIPLGYFHGFNKLQNLGLKSNSIVSMSFVRSIGPSLKTFYMRGTKIIDVPADTFVNASGIVNLFMGNNFHMTKFEVSNIKYMPLLETLELSHGSLSKIGNATSYCRGSACTNLEILIDGNPIPCDKHLCWAKMNTSITVTRDNCLGRIWNNITLNGLPCPKGRCFC